MSILLTTLLILKKKIKVGLWDHRAVCVFVTPINFWMPERDFYETWYVHHGNWTRLNSVLHKPIPSVYVFVFVTMYRLC
jgi:hypothetical protein